MPELAPVGSLYAPPGSASVLSFHGGGFRGYFSALIANGLEARKAQLGDSRPLGESFDVICGTSVGSIIAVALAAGVPISRLLELFEEHGERIFPPRYVLKTKPGFFRARFKSDELYKVLSCTLKEKKLGDLDRALIVPAINETSGKPVIFRSCDKSQEEIKLIDIAMASAAAPMYLPLHRFNKQRYTDGGIVANGPELIAASDLVSRFDIPVAQQRILSVGTTMTPNSSKIPLSRNDRWGVLRWVFKYNRLQPLLMDGQVEIQRELLRSLGPRQQIHLDIELTDEQQKHVHLVLAGKKAREALKNASEACLAGVSGSRRTQLDTMLSRIARRVAYFPYAGSSVLRPGLSD
jgi:predicted acylesterase/phospholipase RssA